jgi:hypothetical protein
MTVIFPSGSIWDTRATYLAVPVNTMPGVMGAGMALEAAKRWPDLKPRHADWCRGYAPRGGAAVEATPGVLFVATKEDWRKPSRIEWVRRGLSGIRDLVRAGQSVALPLLGCGHGGLDPAEVEQLIVAEFGGDQERAAEVYR